ncbi:MAG: hypothetical protein FJ247_13230 [Nitrospira sp.]|nr:hypothetical protein [Nitrospira sp.]
MHEPIYDDPVVAEIHAIRKALLDQCGSNIDEYRRRVRDHQAASGRRIITRPLKTRTEQSDARERENVSRNG